MRGRQQDLDRGGAHPKGRATAALPRRHPVLTSVVVVIALVAGLWAVRLAQVAGSIGDYRDYWQQPRGEAGGLLYVALGDSAAQGIGASRPERGYVGLLAERMRAQTGAPVQVVNLSRSGATVRDLVEEQLPRLRALQPDVVTVAVGGNDVRSYRADRFAADVEELMAALPAGTFIADVPWFMHGRWAQRSSAAAAAVATSARAHGLRVVPLHAAMAERGPRSMLTDFAADWFHPNDRGHRQWADAVWAELRGAAQLQPGSPPA